MGLLNKLQPPSSPPPPQVENLSIDEIEFILNLIKNSNFKGEELDVVYRAVIKLQNQYIVLNK